jgi:RNA recognition motif-containing protein
MSDPITGMSRGYGFVRFSDDQEQQSALQTMQGVYCGNRPMRISTATPKQRGGPSGMMGNNSGMPMHQTPMNMQGMSSPVPHHQPVTHSGQPVMGFYGQGAPQQQMYGGYPPALTGGPHHGGQQPMNQFTDPNNTTVFVGGLSGYVTEDELRSFFQGFGEITYVKIPPGKGCGFVQFVQRHAAEMAINQMQGYPIGNSRVRLSWGRSQNNSGPAGTPYRPAPPPPMGMQGPMTPMAQGGMGIGMNPMSPMQQGGAVGYYGQPYGPAGAR